MDFNIKDYLKRFIGLTPPNDYIKEKVSEVIKKEINIEIKKEEIEVSGKTIYLKVKPIIKNEVFIRKDIFLKFLHDELGDKAPKDIR